MLAVHENFCMELPIQQIKGFTVCSDGVLLPVQLFFFNMCFHSVNSLSLGTK